MILGLDISTSITGWALVERDGTFVAMGYIPLAKEKTLFSKARVAKEHISKLTQQYDVTDIAIERNLQKFRRGLSSAAVIEKLAKFNGVISYVVEEMTGLVPYHLDVNASRKALGIKVLGKKHSALTTKEQVFNHVSLYISQTSFVWPTKKLKSGKRKGLVVNEAACFDMADAWVIAKAHHVALLNTAAV
jgi:Holliday junction resolvasome RuvABC endonuclease subunit